MLKAVYKLKLYYALEQIKILQMLRKTFKWDTLQLEMQTTLIQEVLGVYVCQRKREVKGNILKNIGRDMKQNQRG